MVEVLLSLAFQIVLLLLLLFLLLLLLGLNFCVLYALRRLGGNALPCFLVFFSNSIQVPRGNGRSYRVRSIYAFAYSPFFRCWLLCCEIGCTCCRGLLCFCLRIGYNKMAAAHVLCRGQFQPLHGISWFLLSSVRSSSSSSSSSLICGL